MRFAITLILLSAAVIGVAFYIRPDPGPAEPVAPRVVRRVILDCPHGCFKDYDRRQQMVCEEVK